MRLATRVAKLEKVIKPLEPGCDRCRGFRVFGDGDYTETEVGGQKRRACIACGMLLGRTHKVIVGVNLRDVL